MKHIGYFVAFALLASPALAAEISGETILTEKCSVCHAAPDPSSFDAATWAKNVERMAPNAALSNEEIEAVKKLNMK